MTKEMVKFRLFQMPCCGYLLCWVNPRLPTYCPECGKMELLKLRTGECTKVDTEQAWLSYK